MVDGVGTPCYGYVMPTKGNPSLEVRMTPERKARLQAAAHNAGTNASTVVNQLIDWWMGTAELPERSKEATVTTTEYGSWGRYVMAHRPEDTVADYLGEFADDFDHEGLTDAYRDAINEQLGDTGIVLRGPEFYGPYPHIDDHEQIIRDAIEAAELEPLLAKFDRSAD